MSNSVDNVKIAQAQLVTQVAEEAGIDINSMSDVELAKFASHVLNAQQKDNGNMNKVAEAEVMGRVMARAYVDEQMKIASALETGNWAGLEDVAPMFQARQVQTKVASATSEIAQEWFEVKEAAKKKKVVDNIAAEAADGRRTTQINAGTSMFRDSKPQVDKRSFGEKAKEFGGKVLRGARNMTGYDDIRQGLEFRSSANAFGDAKNLSAAEKKSLENLRSSAKSKLLWGAGKATGTAAALGGLSYGAYRLAGGGSEKKSSFEKEAALQYVEALDPVEFAKLAELRAAEILAANGIHPETFEEIEPTAIKLAEFPSVDDCYTWQGRVEMAQYNEMLDNAAQHIINSL